MERGNQRRKHWFRLVVIAVTAAACLAAFGLLRWLPWQHRTFYEGTTINNVDVSGLTVDEAYDKLDRAKDGYSLTVAFYHKEEVLSANDLGLKMGEKSLLTNVLKSEYEGGSPEESTVLTYHLDNLYTCNKPQVAQTVSDWEELTAYSGKSPADAFLYYDDEAGAFAIQEEQAGGVVDAAELTDAIKRCAGSLTQTLDVMGFGLYGTDIRSAESDEMQQALKRANALLEMNLTYRYNLRDEAGKVTSAEESIGRRLLAEWLYVDTDGLTVRVDSKQLQAYVNHMQDAYSYKGDDTSSFVTTGGERIEVNLPSEDSTVDSNALYNDILDCITHQMDGERDAPYVSETVTDLGGTYVEIDLDKQHLWLYQDSNLVTEGDICSGDVASGSATPAGLYTIGSKETDCWLSGSTWNNWVSYWLPFNGSIGLNDSTWRSGEEYGGNVYLNDGSHGSIDMPLELAKTVYENVEAGTYVILYGSQAAAQDQEQTITGTSYYDKVLGEGAFYLDSWATGDSMLTYFCDNTNVARVNSAGLVTIVGSGTAVIRITAIGTANYKQAVKYVTISVSDASNTDGAGENDGETPQKAPEQDENTSEEDGDNSAMAPEGNSSSGGDLEGGSYEGGAEESSGDGSGGADELSGRSVGDEENQTSGQS